MTVAAAQDANATDDTATLTNTAEGGGYDGESAGVTVTVTDDETAPTAITLTASPGSVLESASGTTVTVTATLDGSVTLGAATEVTVSVGGGTATSGTDYAEVDSFTVTIPAERTSGTGTFNLTPTQDTIAEGDETIDVDGAVDGFTVTKAQVTLTDDDTAPKAITLTASPASVSESASETTVTVTATLDGSATLLTATTVTVSVGGGSATSGTDYTAVSDFTVTIPKESARGTGTFTLTPTQDTIAEGDETIDVDGAADGFTVTKAEVTLSDDETAPGSITLTVSPTTVEEDDGATTVTVTATLGGSATLPDATEVTVSVGGGSATSGTDYTAVSNFTVTIPEESASGTGTFTLTPTNDSLAEGDETIDVTGMATDFTVTKAQVTLTDDMPPVEVSFARASYTVAEGGTVTVTVELSAVPEREVEVALTHAAQGDTTAADYSGVPTSVTFDSERDRADLHVHRGGRRRGRRRRLGAAGLRDAAARRGVGGGDRDQHGVDHRRRRAAGAGVLRAGRLHRCGGFGGNGDGAPGRCSRAPGVGADHRGESGRHDGGGLFTVGDHAWCSPAMRPSRASGSARTTTPWMMMARVWCWGSASCPPGCRRRTPPRGRRRRR